MTNANIQLLTLKANREELTNADIANLNAEGLIVMNTMGTSFEDVLARQAMRRQNNVVRG